MALEHYGLLDQLTRKGDKLGNVRTAYFPIFIY